MTEGIRVGLSRDFLSPEGSLAFGDIGLGLLDAAPGVAYEFFGEHHNEVTPDQIGGYDAIILLSAHFTRRTFAGARRLALLARFGVGYDNVDVEAATEANVALTITPDGVRRPVATAIVALMLALASRMLDKDRLIRAGRWVEKIHYQGIGLTGRTLGSIGVGNIGQELFRLARPFEMRHLGYDPFVRPEDVAGLGVELVDLRRLLAESDFVSVNCPLTAETRAIIGERELRQMKPTAYLINTSRGPLLDQRAVTRALEERWIAGAGLDVFEEEPIRPDDPLLGLDNAILSPHALSWTDEAFRGNGLSACRGILRVARGLPPLNVVNREVLERPGWLEKLARFRT